MTTVSSIGSENMTSVIGTRAAKHRRLEAPSNGTS